MRTNLLNIITAALATIATLFCIGFSIGSNSSMPDYARVYIDDDAKTYLALPCLAEWQSRKSDTIALLRLGTAAESRKLNYQPDKNCRDTGAFFGEDSSLSKNFLIRLGILQPIREWWDGPYRNELGEVVNPQLN
jgi:hypothetical protein